MIIHTGYNLSKSLFPEFQFNHPDYLLEYLEKVEEDIHTNSDIVINFFRVKHKRKEIELKILYYHKSGKVEEIQVDQKGELSNYPANFLQHNTNLLFQLV